MSELSDGYLDGLMGVVFDLVVMAITNFIFDDNSVEIRNLLTVNGVC